MGNLAARAIAQDLLEADAAGRIVVAIDTLRAATTAAAALAAGATAIWPAADLDEARGLAAALPGALLAGERAMRPPAGFDLGNSPREHSAERVAGRAVVLSTTNGTLALSRARGARAVAFASLATASLCARWLRGLGSDALIVMAGTDGRFAHEDALTAGAIASGLPEAGIDDLLRTARAAYLGARERLVEEFLETPHGERLADAGFAADVRFCALADSLPALPVRDDREPRRLIAWRG